MTGTLLVAQHLDPGAIPLSPSSSTSQDTAVSCRGSRRGSCSVNDSSLCCTRRCLHGGAVMINSSRRNGRRCTTLVENGVRLCLVQHTTKAALATRSTGRDGYSLDRLKLICEGKLADRVTVDTVATTLALAEQHNCSQLKDKCVDFITGHLDAVLETEGYKHLEASCPIVLTQLLKAAHGRNN
ncbi:hypothetical protein PR202_ga25500 [Eleusine coracana subsp. coracana]|uniref:BPM/SPOP BACK domain-containing protein n=1 Tax=Eleusine coracana subsp. coracana TaxID=191504 RepID=A0AAV5DB79_ELECO|nr:hypothetical protein PR202_ga25439 [Eleusine coracana subsp. coracana]GJN07655.1 hypothetical protein PR202_ga25500 [Eleusine coracana subsp. coracana]